MCIRDRNESGCVVTLWHSKSIKPASTLKRHVINDDCARCIAPRGNLVEALCQLPPDIKGEALGRVNELEGLGERIGVGRVFVIIEGVIDQIVFAEGRRWMWPGGDDNDFPFNILWWVVVVVLDQFDSDALGWR